MLNLGEQHSQIGLLVHQIVLAIAHTISNQITISQCYVFTHASSLLPILMQHFCACSRHVGCQCTVCSSANQPGPNYLVQMHEGSPHFQGLCSCYTILMFWCSSVNCSAWCHCICDPEVLWYVQPNLVCNHCPMLALQGIICHCVSITDDHCRESCFR